VKSWKHWLYLIAALAAVFVAVASAAQAVRQGSWAPLRVRQSLAQGQLAEAMGVSRQTINSIENERYTPSLPLALALARYFGVTVEEMFDEQGL